MNIFSVKNEITHLTIIGITLYACITFSYPILYTELNVYIGFIILIQAYRFRFNMKLRRIIFDWIEMCILLVIVYKDCRLIRNMYDTVYDLAVDSLIHKIFFIELIYINRYMLTRQCVYYMFILKESFASPGQRIRYHYEKGEHTIISILFSKKGNGTESECSICYNNEISSVMFRCKHSCCLECFIKIYSRNMCPICRGQLGRINDNTLITYE